MPQHVDRASRSSSLDRTAPAQLFDEMFCIFVIRRQTSPHASYARVCPLPQDTKKGKLRFYHGPIFWNYGYIPQTWEDPNVKHPKVKRPASYVTDWNAGRRSDPHPDTCMISTMPHRPGHSREKLVSSLHPSVEFCTNPDSARCAGRW